MALRCVLRGALLAIAAVPALASPVLAGPRDDVLAGATRCSGITDDRTFLDCYYGAAQPLRATLGLPPAPGSQQNLVPMPRPGAPAAPPLQSNNYAPAKPGFFGRLLNHADVKPEPPTRMTSYKFDNGGFFIVSLANGETWRQSQGDTTFARWRGKPGTYVVTIMPGQPTPTMKVGENEMYQVQRVQ